MKQTIVERECLDLFLGDQVSGPDGDYVNI